MVLPQNKSTQLQLLIEDNFVVAKHCRQTMETIAEVSLRHYFQQLASKRSQFAMELGQQMNFLGVKNPYVPSLTYNKRWSDITDENKLKNIRKALKLYKVSLKNYERALGTINNGHSREILIRHKAHLQAIIRELKGLKKITQSSGIDSEKQTDEKESGNIGDYLRSSAKT